MGNCKSRPALTCADECKKRISEAYSLVRSHLNDDIKPRFDNQTPFFHACFQGSYDEFVASFDPKYLDERVPPRDLSLLHLISIGIGESQSKKIEYLLSKCDDSKRRELLSQRTPNNFSILHMATYKSDCSVVEALLKAGAEINLFVENAPSPLHLASMCGHHELIELFQFYGTNLHDRDFVHFTPLNTAVFFSHEKAVKTLLKLGADPNYTGAVNDRPLHIAAGRPHLGIVKMLLDAGADSLMTDDEGNSAIHFAASSGHSAILSAILSKSDNAQSLARKTNIYKDSALHVACYNGKLDSAKIVLQYAGGSILQAENFFHETPLQAACTAGKSFELVAFLMRQHDVDINLQSSDGHTALHSACFHGHLRIVQYLLENGADQSLTARATEPTNNEGRGRVSSAILALSRQEASANDPMKSMRSSSYGTIEEDLPQQQTPIIWAYEKGHDQIVALLKYYANKRADSDVCSEYSSGDSSYTPLPSPLGRLRSITKEKAEILQLRGTLNSVLHLSLMDIELLEAIGSGSFGKVYRGVYKGKVVAIKRYRALAFGNKSEIDIFCREVTILSRLKHPNVIGFIGACLDDPSQFAIITEFAAVGSLFSLLHVQKRVLEPELRLCIGVDVAKGMKYLHECTSRPVIHRDLNPNNILIHQNGKAVVADFGESRFMTENEEDSMTKQPGNLRWMAPEVFTQTCQYDQKVDVFSYSLVVWEIHSAELPFSNLKPAAAAAEMAYKRSRPQLPSAETPQFPAHIIEMITSGWDNNPVLRPTFSQILNIIETHAIPDEDRNFVLKRNQSDSSDEGEYSDTDDMIDLTNSKTVSRLKSQWEKFCVDDSRLFATPSKSPTTKNVRTNSAVQKLRQQIDTNGYVMHSARSIPPTKSLSLRDSLALSKGAKIAQRQLMFQHDEKPTGNFTSATSPNKKQPPNSPPFPTIQENPTNP